MCYIETGCFLFFFVNNNTGEGNGVSIGICRFKSHFGFYPPNQISTFGEEL